MIDSYTEKITASAYVDLNPIRAKIASSPEDSNHTSIQHRIEHVKNNQRQTTNRLYPFVGNPRKNMPEGLPFRLADYIELVDITGRIMRDDKRGFINQNAPPILQRLNIAPENWMYLSRHFESKFKRLVGSALNLKAACKSLGYKRTPSLRYCEKYFT